MELLVEPGARVRNQAAPSQLAALCEGATPQVGDHVEYWSGGMLHCWLLLHL